MQSREWAKESERYSAALVISSRGMTRLPTAHHSSLVVPLGERLRVHFKTLLSHAGASGEQTALGKYSPVFTLRASAPDKPSEVLKCALNPYPKTGRIEEV